MKLPSKISPFIYVFFALFMLLIVIRYFVGFDGLYSQDSYEYLRYSKAIGNWFAGGDHPGQYFWASLYPFIGALLSKLGFTLSFALQLLSVVGTCLTFVYASKIIRLLFPFDDTKGSRSYLVLVLLLSPFLFRITFCVMTDALSIGVMTTALYYVLEYAQSKSTKTIIIAIVLSAVAFNIRYAAGVLLLVPIGFAVFRALRDQHIVSLSMAGVLVLLVFVPHYLLQEVESLGFLKQHSLAEWSISNMISRVHVTQNDGTIVYHLPNIIALFELIYHPGFMILGILSLVFIPWRKTMPQQKILIAAVGTYLLFLAGMNLQNSRFLLTALPVVLILLYPGWNNAESWCIQKIIPSRMVILGGIVTVQLGLIFYVMMPFVHKNTENKSVVNAVDKMEGDIVYTLGLEGALKAYGDKEVISLWGLEGNSIESEAVVVINEPWLKQYKSDPRLIPAFYHYKTNNKLKFVGMLQEKWAVYRVK